MLIATARFSLGGTSPAPDSDRAGWVKCAARDQRLGRSVAVVFLRAIIPPNTWHSFRPDDGASGLRHVAVYDAGTVDIEMSTRPGEVFDL